MKSSKPQFVEERGQKVKLNNLCSRGKSSLRQKDVSNDGPYAVYGASGLVGTMASFQNAVPYVAVVKDGAGVGRASACEAKTSVLGTMQALIPSEGIDRDYLLHLVRSLHLGDGFSGSTIPHIYFKDYGKLPVRLHSPAEQKRIVDIFASIERQIKVSKQQLDQLDSLVKSRFIEMFGDPVEENRWARITLASLCTKLGSGATPRGGKAAYKTSGIPLIRSMNVHNGYFESKDLAYIDEIQAKKLDNVTLHKGDVLLNITGASVARSCLLPDYLAGGRVNQHVSIVRCDPNRMLPRVLNSIFTSDSYQRFLLEHSRMAGATREAITKDDLETMTVPLPPLSLQYKFAAFVAQVDKSRFGGMLHLLNSLSGIMHASFFSVADTD
ncbi:restriction endonuclease subunit S [Bifidobacterium adolescentis]|jgi:type I restriction enzyme, S subunit|uniref:restriction endonuclease subunit S n=8 Tax=Bifidobacterium adolescentis TaxID=1680 RepID=UPI0022E1F405|nr:restriction endonuclease subunit S [Bifidobacterium adolescentis]MDB0596638.1 restriction endonuclease subunit S [Bifidobacterium adolescentis]MDB0628909.1 restriction endonuclease subunit S [Bifidobacterium adolescentis]MDB0630891.1 restriction endonuclease subunit S [Bifidobacterium adolescentis]MDB0649570.1 restriction endonuclease subunit S [Bifidobacterium adolescentis]MDB1396709.1 restriction endonuclease subunit S [Bifidobacterium adolescentis]